MNDPLNGALSKLASVAEESSTESVPEDNVTEHVTLSQAKDLVSQAITGDFKVVDINKPWDIKKLSNSFVVGLTSGAIRQACRHPLIRDLYGDKVLKVGKRYTYRERLGVRVTTGTVNDSVAIAVLVWFGDEPLLCKMLNISKHSQMCKGLTEDINYATGNEVLDANTAKNCRSIENGDGYSASATWEEYFDGEYYYSGWSSVGYVPKVHHCFIAGNGVHFTLVPYLDIFKKMGVTGDCNSMLIECFDSWINTTAKPEDVQDFYPYVGVYHRTGLYGLFYGNSLKWPTTEEQNASVINKLIKLEQGRIDGGDGYVDLRSSHDKKKEKAFSRQFNRYSSNFGYVR